MNPNDVMKELRRIQRLSAIEKGVMTLGEIIDALESVDQYCNNGDIKEVTYDFGYFVPTDLDSWRGSYENLALGYNNDEAPLLTDLIERCKRADGATYMGWKGGDYLMTMDTPVYVSNPGEACDTGIIGVHDAGWKIVLQTGYAPL